MTEGRRSARSVLARFEVDTRLLGMIVALAILWVAFNFLSDGLFLSPRNLWNLSVQSAAVAIMTTGMVLIIVSRNIDLSIGSILVFTAMVMGLLQAEWLPALIGPGYDPSFFWIVALLAGDRRRSRPRRHPGVPDRVPQDPVVHRDPRRPADLARRGIPAGQGQDDRPTRRNVPAARRGAQGSARRDDELARRRARDPRPGLWTDRRPPPPEAVRLPAASTLGGCFDRRRR